MEKYIQRVSPIERRGSGIGDQGLRIRAGIDCEQRERVDRKRFSGEELPSVVKKRGGEAE